MPNTYSNTDLPRFLCAALSLLEKEHPESFELLREVDGLMPWWKHYKESTDQIRNNNTELTEEDFEEISITRSLKPSN